MTQGMANCGWAFRLVRSMTAGAGAGAGLGWKAAYGAHMCTDVRIGAGASHGRIQNSAQEAPPQRAVPLAGLVGGRGGHARCAGAAHRRMRGRGVDFGCSCGCCCRCYRCCRLRLTGGDLVCLVMSHPGSSRVASMPSSGRLCSSCTCRRTSAGGLLSPSRPGSAAASCCT